MKRYDFGSIRIEFYIKNNVEKHSQTLVSRISGCIGKVAGILFFFSIFGLDQIVGGQSRSGAVYFNVRSLHI